MSRVILATILAILTPTDGTAAEQSLPFSCAQIRWYASFHSMEELEAVARKYRLNRAQRTAARACLREKA